MTNDGADAEDVLSALWPHFNAYFRGDVKNFDDAACKVIISVALENARADEREACASAVEKAAVLLDKKECCGFGVGSPPDCCGDPLYMISERDAAAAIRSRR
jgi:hypothetical protein